MSFEVSGGGANLGSRCSFGEASETRRQLGISASRGYGCILDGVADKRGVELRRVQARLLEKLLPCAGQAQAPECEIDVSVEDASSCSDGSGVSVDTDMGTESESLCSEGQPQAPPAKIRRIVCSAAHLFTSWTMRGVLVGRS